MMIQLSDSEPEVTAFGYIQFTLLRGVLYSGLLFGTIHFILAVKKVQKINKKAKIANLGRGVTQLCMDQKRHCTNAAASPEGDGDTLNQGWVFYCIFTQSSIFYITFVSRVID